MARVAYITSTFPDYKKCGTGIYASYVCQALAQQDHDIHVVTSALPDIRPTLGKLTVHKAMQTWNPLDLPRLVQLFHQIKPEIIHINHPTAIAAQKHKILVNMIPEINRATWRLPLVTTLHEYIHVSLLGRVKLHPFLHSSDIVTVTNERASRAVRAAMPESHQARVRIVNIGSMLDEGRPPANRIEQRTRWGLSENDKVIGFVGFMTPPKGFHNLIQAAAPLLREDRSLKILALSSWNLSGPVYRQKVLDLMTKEKVAAQVIITGFLENEDLWNSLSAIDLCVFPFDEPVEDRSSGPLRQAIFHGLPTIAFADRRDYDEFGFQHEENIWFTPMGDLDTLRSDMRTLLDNPTLRAKIAAGTKSLRVPFSNDTVSNAFSRIYAELLARK